ncbi:uncharacterized protein [Antedon mediterranea]|uniref:uncharacterized protein n=1 Tax=Antedon mediterranea TaxID=105859 RepID=UPI003AF6CA8D
MKKSFFKNYSLAEVKVREATSNDPWGPSSSILSEIAELTENVVLFTEIMAMLWKRMNDHGKNWRHVYKALIVLEYIIKKGSERVAQQCKENIFAINTLKDFRFVDDNGKDQGVNVREKSKHIVALLKNDTQLKSERSCVLKTNETSAQSSHGLGSDRKKNKTETGSSSSASPTSNGAYHIPTAGSRGTQVNQPTSTTSQQSTIAGVLHATHEPKSFNETPAASSSQQPVKVTSVVTSTPVMSSAFGPQIEMSENDFCMLKSIVSNYYDRHGCLIMLKVLFADLVRKHKLDSVTSTMDLLNALAASGDVSHDDITILYDTINLTGHLALQSEIRKQFQLFPDVKQRLVTRFTKYRQKIMQFGMGIGEQDVVKIDGYYNNPVMKYESSWKMVYDLEYRQIIKENKIKEFIALLNDLNLPWAAELLE